MARANSASIATIMSALYVSVLRPQDRVAVKPHASPAVHATFISPAAGAWGAAQPSEREV